MSRPDGKLSEGVTRIIYEEGTATADDQASFLDNIGANTKITSVDPPISGGEIPSSHPTISGVAPRNSFVTLYLNGSAVATGNANSSGSWSIAVPSQLNGAFDLVARALPGSSTLSFTINDPLQPVLSSTGEPAVFDMNNTGGVFYSNGKIYSNRLDLLSALSGSVSGVTYSIGPYVDPAGIEYITNGTFDSTTTGWTASNATISITSGELVVDSSTAAASVSQTLTGYQSRAFAFTGTGRRGTNTTNSPFIAATTQNSTFSGNVSVGSPVSAGNTTNTVYISSGFGSATYFGVKYATGLGTTIWDNFSVREVMPMPGWTAFANGVSTAPGPAYSVLVDATTPAALPSSGQVKVIWQADANQERDRVRLFWTDTGRIHLVTTTNNGTTADLDLGAVAVSTSFKVAFGISQGVNATAGTGVAASLNGANAMLQQTSGTAVPGVSHMRIGRPTTAISLWDGAFDQVAVVRNHQPSDWLEFVAGPTNAIWTEGDSYMAGAGGAVLTNLLEASTGRITINSAVGGSTLQNIRDRVSAKSYLREKVLVEWDGSANGFVDVPTSIALLQDMVNSKADSKYLFIGSINVPNPGSASSPTVSSYTTALAALRAQMLTTFGAAHVYDPLPKLQSLGTGSADDNNDIAAGLAPRSTLLTQNSGEVHLSLTALTAIANDSVMLSKISSL